MSGRSILIVEPNPGILIVGRNVLARAGFNVIAVSSVEEGMAHARRRSLDVILLDGRHSEPEVLITLSRSKPRGVPIILTVQKGRDVITIEALEAGGWSGLVDISDVIEKPFAPERLLQAVEKAVQRNGEHTDPHFEREGLVLLADGPEVESSGEGLSERMISDENTDRYHPFGSLLDSVTQELSSDRAHTPVLALTQRAQSATQTARLTKRVRAVLGEEGVHLDVRLVAALVRACESAMAEERMFEGSGRPEGNLALAGYIEHLPLDQVLQLAASVGNPSRCRLEHENQAVEVFFKKGQVVFARQEKMPEGFTLGRFLAASGVVNQKDVDRMITTRTGINGWIGQRLLAMGFIREKDLRDALRRQSEELVYEAVRWNDGRFAVFANEPLPPEAEDAQISLAVPHLLLEGMRRLDEWRRIAGEVGGLRSVLDRLDCGLDVGDVRTLIESLRPDERMLLEQVDGRRTVEDLVKSSRRPTFDVFKALHHLSSKRLVTVVASPATA